MKNVEDQPISKNDDELPLLMQMGKFKGRGAQLCAPD
jgi:hypothetical protein